MFTHRILQPGRNCWRIEHSDKVAFLIDGKDYFCALYHSILQAQQMIQILAWDIDSRFKLIRDASHISQLPRGICDLLDAVVKKRGKLHAYVLNWDVGMIYGADREFMPIYKFDKKTHRRPQRRNNTPRSRSNTLPHRIPCRRSQNLRSSIQTSRYHSGTGPRASL